MLKKGNRWQSVDHGMLWGKTLQAIPFNWKKIPFYAVNIR